MAKIKPRQAVVTIYTGDYLDRIRHLERKAEAQQKAQAGLPLLNGEPDPDYLQTAREHDELVAEAEAEALHVTLQALGRRVWSALVADHPPRKDGDTGAREADVRGDARLGVNEDTFREALVYGGTVTIDGKEVEYASIVEPNLSREDLDALSFIDFERLFFSAYTLNRTPTTDPKASLVSRLTPTSEETSS